MKIGIWGLLTLVFVLAKLGHVIDWSWWLVFSPLLLGTAIGLIFLLIVMVLAAVGSK
jgi:hypothetical protein